MQKKIVGPSFGESANRTGPNEGRGFDPQPRLLHDVGDRTDVVLVGPCRAVGANLHLLSGDLAGQRGHGINRALPRSRQSEGKRVNPQRFHQMKDLNLLGDRRIANRRRLQPVTQSLIVQQHRPRRLQSRRMVLVPVVDEFGGVHGTGFESLIS